MIASAILRLVTQSDTKHIDSGCAQSAAQNIELIEIIGWANSHAMVSLVIDRHTLYRRLDAVQGQLRAPAISIGTVASITSGAPPDRTA